MPQAAPNIEKLDEHLLEVVRALHGAVKQGISHKEDAKVMDKSIDDCKEILDVIHHFGSRKKIFNVHFRNIQGRFLDFRETFIDDGDVDMLAALRVYKEVGYDGMLMPDHVPRIAGDADGRQAFAYTFGYIKALIRAVEGDAAAP